MIGGSLQPKLIFIEKSHIINSKFNILGFAHNKIIEEIRLSKDPWVIINSYLPQSKTR